MISALKLPAFKFLSINWRTRALTRSFRKLGKPLLRHADLSRSLRQRPMDLVRQPRQHPREP
jgi:hypothetical protein